MDKPMKIGKRHGNDIMKQEWAKNANDDKGRGTNIVIIKIRGVWDEEEHIEKLVGKTEIVVVTETLMTPSDLDFIHRVSEQSSTRPIHDRLQEIGRVALKINQIKTYRVINKALPST